MSDSIDVLSAAGYPSRVPVALVVDPDPDTRKLHSLTLASVATEIDEAEDGAFALARAVARRPDLVVTELRLPRIDGYALCHLLRCDRQTQAATILVVTASALPADVARAQRAGADAVLVKPADPQQVRQRALDLLARAQRVRDAVVGAQPRVEAQLALARAVLAENRSTRQRILSRDYQRERTASPPSPPPDVRCADCDRPLRYDHSNLGGVSAKLAEQWDYFTCEQCGCVYQYRHRTRRLRRI